MFNRLNVKTLTAQMASIATNASAIQPIFRAPAAMEVVGLRFIASTSQPAATTTASGLTITVYKNASNAGSIVGTFNTSGTGLATNAGAAGSLSATTSLKKFAAGDVLLIEETGGVAMGSTLGAFVNVDFIYGYED